MHADPTYLDKIRAAARNPAELAAWLEGSWDIVAGGMIDDVWRPEVHVLPTCRIPDGWFLDRSFDWGSSRPFSVGWWATSDGSHLVLPDGTRMATIRGDKFRVAEWYGWNGQPNEGLRMTNREIADGILDRQERLFGSRRPRPGPADSSIFDQINGNSIAHEMEQAGVTWLPAHKGPGSRRNGWQKLRDMLQASAKPAPRELPGMFVFDCCDQFLRTVPVLPRSDRDLDDVDCFVAGTLVSTTAGDRRIENVSVGDMVHTPIGPCRVTKSYLSGAASTTRVELSNGQILQGTARHKVFVPGVGLVRLDNLHTGVSLTWNNQRYGTEEMGSLRCGSTALYTENTQVEPILSVVSAMPSAEERPYCTEQFGDFTKDPFQMECISTTKTATLSTTRLGTSRSSLPRTMPDYTCPIEPRPSGTPGRYGQTATKEKNSFDAISEPWLKIPLRGNLRALIVERLLSQNTRHKSTAHRNVPPPMAPVCLESRVLCAVPSSGVSHIRPEKCRHAPINVVGLFVDETPRNVYNLTIERAGLFIAAGGVLCSNTDAEDHIGDEVRYNLYRESDRMIRKRVSGR